MVIPVACQESSPRPPATYWDDAPGDNDDDWWILKPARAYFANADLADDLKLFKDLPNFAKVLSKIASNAAA